MNDPLVVLTYPGHFLLTVLTIRSYLEHNSSPEITVIVDDIAKGCWPGYVEDCHAYYSTLHPNVTIIPVSKWSLSARCSGPRDGWLRQQYLKLHLDQLLPYQRWMFTDGDMWYVSELPTDCIPYTITRGGEFETKSNRWCELMLNINPVGCFTAHPDMNWGQPGQEYQVCVSNPPFRTMEAQTLADLRNYVETVHGCNILDVDRKIYCEYNKNPGIQSEWELIANFQLRIQQRSIPLVYFAVRPFENMNSNRTYCGTTYTPESIERSWYQTRGIECSDEIWNNIKH